MNQQDAEMQADQLVERILSHPSGGVAALLGITNFQEVEWLEFKAAACALPKAKRSSTPDLRWRIARAVIAMANGRGGCVLIGIDDNGQATGIKHSDPNNWIGRFGDDYFLRKTVVEQILRPAGGWKTGKGRVICDRTLPDFCTEVRLVKHSGERVVAIIVHPLPAGAPLLRVVNEEQAREFIPVRQLGHIGCVRELFREQEIRDHDAQRRPASPEYLALWRRFSTHLGDPISALEDEIETYAAAVKHRLCRLDQEFTALDGRERRKSTTDADVSVPQAEEVFRWLDPDDAWGRPPSETDETNLSEREATGPPERIPRKGSVLALLRDEPRSILLGHPGSGKTACLQRLALDAAHAYADGGEVSIFVSLAAYRRGGLFPLLRRVSNISISNLEHLARSRRLRLLLDGLNECPSDLAAQCLSEITSVIECYSDLRVVLSTRTVSYRDEIRLPTFVIRPMSEQQQLNLLAAQLHGLDPARQLLVRLKRVPGAPSFVSNPQLLFVASQVAQQVDDVPKGRALLYQAYISEWFKREERKAQNANRALAWDWGSALNALSLLAFRMRTRGRRVCDFEFVRRTLDGVIPDPLYFIDRLAQGLLFVADRIQGTFGFEHETIQEFLCAHHLLTQPSSLRSVADSHGADRDLWAMPVALLFELADPHPEVTERLWRYDPLLVAVALRSDKTLANLDTKSCPDPWIRGVVHCFRGEPVPETAELKDHELSTASAPVRDALRSDSFWYAGLTHAAGDRRIRRLHTLIAESSEPWADLLRDAFVGHPDWTEEWRDVHSGFLLVCSSAEAFLAYARVRKKAPTDIPLQLVARLVYQLRVPAELWTSTSWFRRLFYNGPWFKLPTLLSVRQWKIAAAKGALGTPERPRSLPAALVAHLLSMPVLVPTLVRMQVVKLDDKELIRIRTSSLATLDDADADHFVRNSLIQRSDVSRAVLDAWLKRAGPWLLITLLRNRFVTFDRVMSSVGDRWPMERRRHFIRRLVDLGLVTDKTFFRDDVTAKDLFESIMVQPADPEYIVDPEPLPDSYIDEAAAVLQMSVNDPSDLAYFLAAANLLSAFANRRRQTRDSQCRWLVGDLVTTKRRIAAELFRAARKRMEGVEVCLRVDFSYVTVFGVQFGFRELPVQQTAEELSSLGLSQPQIWAGRRLQPIARTVMDWARQLRYEERDRGRPQGSSASE